MSASDQAMNAVLTMHWFSRASGLKGVYPQNASVSHRTPQEIDLASGAPLSWTYWLVFWLLLSVSLCNRAFRYLLREFYPSRALESPLGRMAGATHRALAAGSTVPAGA